MFTNTACQIRLESLPESRIFPTVREMFTSFEMNTDANFLFVKYILKCSWADLMAVQHRTLQRTTSVWGQIHLSSIRTAPKFCQVELQLRWHCGCNLINMNAVQIVLNFQVNVMGKATGKYAQCLWYFLMKDQAIWIERTEMRPKCASFQHL